MAAPLRIGRYLLFDSFAKGGMASVHFGRVLGPVGFSRVVAIKRHHAQFAKEPEFVSMIIDEARLAGRIRHPNVVPVIDVVQLSDELLLVLEYVAGVSLARLTRACAERGERVPLPVASAIVCDVLSGLHAAHSAKNDKGESLGIVHRDVSPQNVLLGAEGLARVTDFGIAHAAERVAVTRTQEIKGKLEYMSKEQLRRERVDRRADLYATGVVLWELLTGRRPFENDDQKALLSRVFSGDFAAPSELRSDVPPELDELVLRALSPDATERPDNAHAMAQAMAKALPPASHIVVGEWVSSVAGAELASRERRVAEIEAFRESSETSKSERTLTSEVIAPSDDGPTIVLPPEQVEDTGSTTTTRAIRAPAPVVDPEPVSTPADTQPRAAVLDDTRATAAIVPAGMRESSAELAASDTRVHSVQTIAPTRPASRDRYVVLLPVAAAVLGGIIIVAVALGHRATSVPESDVVAVDASSALGARASDTLGATPSNAWTVVSVVPVAPSSAAASAEVEAGVPPISAPKPRSHLPRPANGNPVPHRPNCNPPYSVDTQGVRVPKPECFKQ